MNHGWRWPAPRVGFVCLHITSLIPDKLSVIPQFGPRCLSVDSVGKVRVVGMGNPVLHTPVERPLIV